MRVLSRAFPLIDFGPGGCALRLSEAEAAVT